jgi:FkbM family methyltransferase
MMISYAQNYEDVILNRVFKDVDKGFYVDVGAYDPEDESVTKHFYDNGWAGINIEPLAENWKRLAEARPRDINLQVALGDRDGEAMLNVVAELGYSSFEQQYAEQARSPGTHCRQRSVPVLRLDTVIGTHTVGETQFLKIDVEGAEARVLAGWDPDTFRPIIVLVESTVPWSPHPNHEAWEPMLLKAGYSFQYFDGLNRFYSRNESPEVAQYFRAPPNVFDEFVLARELRRLEELAYAKAHPVRWLGAKAYDRLRIRSAALWESVTRTNST